MKWVLDVLAWMKWGWMKWVRTKKNNYCWFKIVKKTHENVMEYYGKIDLKY
jgi:hypothetical protein